MRTYNPPQFNISARVWLNAFPAQLTSWNGSVPARAADITSPAQLYVPRYGYGRWHHALSDNAVSTFLSSGFQELRLPKGTPIKTVWGVTEGTTWEGAALVEIPSGSGRLYVAVLVENRHTGFPNEYVVAILAQLRNNFVTSSAGFGIGGTADHETNIHQTDGGFGMGGGARITVPDDQAIITTPTDLPTFYIPFFWSSQAGIGVGGTSTVTQAAGTNDAGIGVGGTSRTPGQGGEVDAGIGVGGTSTTSHAVGTSDAGIGVGATATSSNGTQAEVGGLTCQTATVVSLDTTYNVTSFVGQHKWLLYQIQAGTYKVTATRLSGADVSVRCYFGVCPSPGQWASISTSTETCESSALNAGNLYVRVDAPPSGTTTVAVRVELGTC